MEQLSGMDAGFLIGETPTSHLHNGSLTVFEGSLSFEKFRAHLASRLHLVNRLRQRLVDVPLQLDRPYWVDDPAFNLDMHLTHVALPKPGNWRELRKLASRVFSEPLDRSRALWDMVFVEGLDQIPQVPAGSVAIISKVHHAAIDGMSGNDILGALFDVSSEPREFPAEKWEPDPIPNQLQMAATSAYDFATRPIRLPKLLAKTAESLVKVGVLTAQEKVALPTVSFKVPDTRFNGSFSAARAWNTALLSLDRVKELKRTANVKLNDVVLAVCAGALRRYLQDHNELPAESLVAFMPISVRSEDQKGKLGNQVFGTVVQLATEVDDPLERLKIIAKNSHKGKMLRHAVDAQTLLELADYAPFGLTGASVKLASRLDLSSKAAPPINLTITNVPGPQLPLYMAGHKLLGFMGAAPIGEGVALIISVVSYNGVLSISPLSTPDIMPDMDTFTRYLREAANELETLILHDAKEEEEQDDSEAVQQLFGKLGQHFADTAGETFGVFQFHVEGGGDWVADLNAEPPSVTAGSAESPDAAFSISAEHLIQIISGQLDIQMALMQSKLKVTGDFDMAIKFGRLLAQFSA